MNSIISFKNSRIIQNCSNLCYSNCAIHLLYSLVEFREKIYNTNVINPIDSNHKVNNVLYYLKYIFLLMNKELTPTHSRYDIKKDDNEIKCSRNANGTSNLFYEEIYEPLLKLLIDGDINPDVRKRNLNLLKNCSFNDNLFVNYFHSLKMDPIYNPTCQYCTRINTESAKICSTCGEPLRIIIIINIFEDLFTYFGSLTYCFNSLYDITKKQPIDSIKKYLIFIINFEFN